VSEDDDDCTGNALSAAGICMHLVASSVISVSIVVNAQNMRVGYKC